MTGPFLPGSKIMHKQPNTRRTGELLFVILLGAFSVAAFYEAFLIAGFDSLSSAGVFPMIASGTMVLSGLFILVDTLRKERDKKTERPIASFLEIAPVTLIVMTALVAGYLVVMPYLGFLVTSAIFLGLSVKYLWGRGWIISAVISIGAMTVVYLLFRVVFEVVLPRGTLVPVWLS